MKSRAFPKTNAQTLSISANSQIVSGEAKHLFIIKFRFLFLIFLTKFSPILPTIILSSSVFFAGGECRKIRALKCRKMMHMTFYWGKEVTILFDGWKTTTWLSYTLSLLAIFLLSAFYQYMENLRIKLQLAASARYAKSSAAAASPGLDAPLLFSAAKMRAPKFASAFLFGLNSAVGYMIMLAVMSFNAGVFIAAVVGLAAGYLVFRSELEGGVAATVMDNSCACA